MKHVFDRHMSVDFLDFSHSFVTWLLKDQDSYGRFAIDATCRLQSPSEGIDETFYLLSLVMAGNVYAEKSLIKEPPYTYQAVFSRTEYRVFRTFARFDRNEDNSDPHEHLFRNVDFHLSHLEVSRLASFADVEEATFAPAPLFARVIMPSGAGMTATLDFPVRHMNIQTGTKMFQGETGPLLIPGIDEDTLNLIDRLDVAYTAFNRFEAADFIPFRPVVIHAGEGRQVAVRTFHGPFTKELDLQLFRA